eukprot:5785002-Lingulodinium_polyedra.AAC.1
MALHRGARKREAGKAGHRKHTSGAANNSGGHNTPRPSCGRCGCRLPRTPRARRNWRPSGHWRRTNSGGR